MDYQHHNILLEGLSIYQDQPNFKTKKIFSINDYIENISCFRIPSILTIEKKIIVFSEARIHSCVIVVLLELLVKHHMMVFISLILVG